MTWDRDLDNEELRNNLCHLKVFHGVHSCVEFMFDSKIANWKREKKQIFIEKFNSFKVYEIKVVRQNLSRFVSYIISKTLPRKQRVVNLIHTGKNNFSIVFMKSFTGRIGVGSDKDSNTSDNATFQSSIFICSANHLKISLKNMGETFGSHEELMEKSWIMNKFMKSIGRK